MNVFHLEEFGKLKDVHHTMETCSGFKWATALNSEQADSVITHTCVCVCIIIDMLTLQRQKASKIHIKIYS